MDDFVKDLGLDLNEEDASVEQTPSAAEETAQSEDEQQAREDDAELEERRRKKLEETAEKRQEIESRHANWEQKVADAMVEQLEHVQTTLTSLRTTAASELKDSERIRRDLDTLHGEADKAIRGTEAYLKKLEKEKRSEGEKSRLWERVLGKVWDKFQERVEGLQDLINTWYDELLTKENEEVSRSA